MPSVLTFSTVDWHCLWHRPQAVMNRIASDGWPVVYVDTLGLRSPRFADLPRILSRLRNRWRVSNRPSGGTHPGVQVFSPLLLPFLDSRASCRLNVRLLVPRLREYLRQTGEDDLVIWVYLPTWTVLQCIRAIPHALLVYEAIDALDSNPAGVSRGFHSAEREILRQADLVITSSESLHQEKVGYNPNTHWVPSGVAEMFLSTPSPAAEVEAIQGPRIGFFGTLDHRLNLTFIAELAKGHPEWSLVLIGPARRDLSHLSKLDNLHWLGQKPHEELPAYLSGLDVIFLPYVIDEFTRHIYPAKIHECLALGLPVVATALPSLEPFEGLVRLVRSGEDFSRQIAAALAEDDPELRRQRRELALANSWRVRYQEIRTLVVDSMARIVQTGR